MAIRSIISAYSGRQARGAGLRHAIRIAKHHNAELYGALRHGRPLLERQYRAQLSDDILAILRKTDTDHISEVEQRFNEIVSAAGLPTEGRFIEHDPQVEGRLSELAHGFDLVVMGMYPDDATEAHLSAHPDLVALRSGRPVLVVPDGYEAEGLAERAIIAWDGKRAATRAIGDAMDLLADKAEVTLLSVGDVKPRYTDLVLANMARHGINARAATVEKDGSIAHTLLAEAVSRDAKLIVMGAYEHSKFTHDLFGGVTTDVMRDTMVPVLMAH